MVWKQHECAFCGARFRYRLARTFTSYGRTPEAARQTAADLLERHLRGIVESRPCPWCGAFQPVALFEGRARRVGVPLGGAVAVLAVCSFSMFVPGWVGSFPWPAVVAAGACLAGGVGAWLRRAANPNAALAANRLTAAGDVAAGRTQLLAPGDPAAATAERWPLPRGVWHGVSALLLAVAVVLLFVPRGMAVVGAWRASEGCLPPFVGPGDEPWIKIPSEVKSVGGLWRGAATAVIENSHELETIEPSLTARTVALGGDWGESISVRHKDLRKPADFTVGVRLPDRPELAGRRVRVRVELAATWPEDSPNGFVERHGRATRTVDLELNKSHTGSRYSTALMTAAPLAFILFLVGVVRIVRAESRLRESAPAGDCEPV